MTDFTTKVIIRAINEFSANADEVLMIDNFDKPLTGWLFRLSKVELVYLFFELEKKLGIRLNQQMLDEYGFSSITGIANVLDQSMGVNHDFP